MLRKRSSNNVPRYNEFIWNPATQLTLDSWVKNPGHRALVGFALSALYALIDESYQVSVPGRFGSLTDVTYDLVGVTAGVLLFIRFRPGRPPDKSD